MMEGEEIRRITIVWRIWVAIDPCQGSLVMIMDNLVTNFERMIKRIDMKVNRTRSLLIEDEAKN